MPTLISFLIYTFAIMQQPYGHNYWVSQEPFIITQYQDGTVPRFMAHNDLAGGAFFELQRGDVISVTYPGRTDRFIVSRVLKYRTMFEAGDDPPASTIGFIGEDGVGLTGFQLYDLINDDNYGLVLQTCYEGSRGRLFVIAYPVRNYDERIYRR